MEQYKEFINKCDFIEYDVSKKDIKDTLLKNNLAMDICRNTISEEAIVDILESDEINGYIAVMDGKYIGFVFYKQNYDTFYLSLIATLPKLGFPLGQMLLTMFEEEAKNKQAIDIQASAVVDVIDFYTNRNYEIVYLDRDCQEYSIRKKL